MRNDQTEIQNNKILVNVLGLLITSSLFLKKKFNQWGCVTGWCNKSV